MPTFPHDSQILDSFEKASPAKNAFQKPFYQFDFPDETIP